MFIDWVTKLSGHGSSYRRHIRTQIGLNKLGKNRKPVHANKLTNSKSETGKSLANVGNKIII